ncbi:MAG: hypothetical protein JNM76_03470 [Betaproteobacteria bacterium]|nr:hypothetical protein [Betaproteobacteria bacterium]
MQIPPHVTYVAAGAIVIDHLDRYTVKKLRAAGLDVKTSWFGSDGRLAIEPAGPDGRPSVDEEDKLMALARAGIAFAYDYKQGMDPAGRMLDLCKRGRYVGTFKQLSFGENGPHIVRMPAGEESWLRELRTDGETNTLLQDPAQTQPPR